MIEEYSGVTDAGYNTGACALNIATATLRPDTLQSRVAAIRLVPSPGTPGEG